MAILTVEDLKVFAPDLDEDRVRAMISDAVAEASLIAPSISRVDLPLEVEAQFRAILRRAILRWIEAGSGAWTQWTDSKGPFSHSETIDTRSAQSRGAFWHQELDSLRAVEAAFSGSTGRRVGSIQLGVGW